MENIFNRDSCTDNYFDVSAEIVSSFFTNEQISQLKEKNDWGKELNLDKATTRSICTSDVDSKFLSEKEINKIIIDLYGDDDNTFTDAMTQYSNGKSVYLFGRPLYDRLDDYSEEYYIVVILPKTNEHNQKYIYEKVEDVSNCQKQLSELLN